jgi:hypothetical protein
MQNKYRHLRSPNWTLNSEPRGLDVPGQRPMMAKQELVLTALGHGIYFADPSTT